MVNFSRFDARELTRSGKYFDLSIYYYYLFTDIFSTDKGTVKSFGVLFMEFLEAFDASPSTALWIPALCYFLYSSLGEFHLCRYSCSLIRICVKVAAL